MKGKFSKLILVLLLIVTSLNMNTFAEQQGRNLSAEYQGIDLVKDGKLLNGTGQEYTGGDITADEKFTVLFKWSISDDISPEIKEGDYYEFELPDNIRVTDALTGTLNPGFGTYSVVGKTVRLTFSDKISKGFENNGELVLGLEIDPNTVIEPGPIEIKVPFNESSPYDFMLKPRESFNMIDKGGNPNKEKNPDYIMWDIVFNKNYDKLGSTTVTDLMPEGLTIESIEVYDVVLDLDGEIVSDDVLSNVATTIENNSITFLNDVSRPYRIKIKSLVDKLPEVGETDEYLNIVKLNTEFFDEISASATVSIETGNVLEKEGTKYDPENRTVSWTVKFNGNMEQLSNPLLTDRMDNKLELIRDSLLVTGVDSKELYEFEVNEFTGGFDIQILENFSEEIMITYTTKLKENATLEAEQTFNNEIMFGDIKVYSGYGITQALFWKGNEGINYTDQNVVWTWDINRAREQMKNAFITDVFNSGGLSYIDGSFEMYERYGDKKKLVENVDYTLSSSSTGIVVNLIGNYAIYSDSLVAQYRTNYDIQKGQVIETTLRNTATLQYINAIDETTLISDYETVKVNNETETNGFKSGSYNAVDKSITWSMALNYNRLSFTEATLEDVIQAGQEYIQDSLKVYTYTISPDGKIVVDRDKPINLDTKNITLPSTENDNVLGMRFLDDSSKKIYLVEFKTRIQDNLIKDNYKNTAKYQVNDKTYELDASVDIKYGKELVGKEGVQNKDKFEWGVYINRSQSTLDNVVIKDTPSKNQMIDTDSFEVYGTIVDSDGTIAVNKDNRLIEGQDYTVNVNESETERSFQLSMKNRINSAYYVYYETFSLVTIDNREISNNVSVTADGIEFEDMVDEGSNSFQATYTTGTGNSVIGTYTIKKVDGNGNPLEGVKFSMTYLNNQNFKYEGTTNQEGLVSFTPLRMGDYTLVEEQAISGYTIPQELQDGILVNVNQETSYGNFIHNIYNDSFKVVLEKVDIDGNLLQGAIFNLQKDVDGNYINIMENLNVDERLTIPGLEAGNYRFIEVNSNSGYILNQEYLDFTVSGEEIDDLELKFTNYQGEVVLSKMNSQLEPMGSVQFDLYYEDQLLEKALTTDENGQIVVSKLQPGNYKAYETKADGYITNKKPIEFVIDQVHFGKPDPVQISSINQKGSAVLQKVNELGEPLSDVVFDLQQNKDGEYISLGLYLSNSEGIVSFNELVPGSYRVIEMANPHQYIINKNPIDFVVENNQDYDLLGTPIESVDLGQIVNTRGTVRVEKVDNEGNLLSGAVFEIRDNQGRIVVDNIEVTNGVSVITDLKPGLYNLIEIKAPEGFELDNSPTQFEINFEIEGTFEEQTLKIVNHKVKTSTPKENLPNTGQSNSLNTAIGVSVGLLGLFILVKNKKKKSVNL